MILMRTCPNCGLEIGQQVNSCPRCGFNLKQDNNHDEAQKVSRAAYRKEFKPKKQNTTVQKMIAWVRANATIVFLLGFALLIVMSFSVSLGWICFIALMIWLFIVCDRTDKIEQYTSDRRLTEKMNQLGSDTVNSLEDRREKIRSRSKKFEEGHPRLESEVEQAKTKKRTHFSIIQLSVILTAAISLIVLFSGSGASVVNNVYDQKMSISKVLLTFGGRMLASGQTAIYSVIIYLIWLLLILFPIFIIYHIFKNTKKSQVISFILSLIETIFLLYILFRMSSSVRANTGVLSQLTSQLLTYAVSVGASTYFLILSSLMTTVLSALNIFRKKQD